MTCWFGDAQGKVFSCSALPFCWATDKVTIFLCLYGCPGLCDTTAGRLACHKYKEGISWALLSSKNPSWIFTVYLLMFGVLHTEVLKGFWKERPTSTSGWQCRPGTKDWDSQTPWVLLAVGMCQSAVSPGFVTLPCSLGSWCGCLASGPWKGHTSVLLSWCQDLAFCEHPGSAPISRSARGHPKDPMKGLASWLVSLGSYALPESMLKACQEAAEPQRQPTEFSKLLVWI